MKTTLEFLNEEMGPEVLRSSTAEGRIALMLEFQKAHEAEDLLAFVASMIGKGVSDRFGSEWLIPYTMTSWQSLRAWKKAEKRFSEQISVSQPETQRSET